MSSINTSVDQTLLQYIQSVSGSQATTPAQQLIADIESQSTDTQSQSPQSASTQGPSAGLFGKIASAVTSALQSSNGSTDPNQVIQNAIASLLSQGNSSVIGAVSGPDSDGDSDSSSTAAQDSLDGISQNGSSTPSQFLQTLQKAGVNPQQFRQDLLAALQTSSGQTNLNTLAEAFPPGSVVDQVA